MTRFTSALVGEETLLIGCGDQLLDHGHGIAAVITTNPQVRGWAAAKGLPVHESASALLGGTGFDWLFSIANLSVIPDDVLALPAKGAINFHDGPLPRMAGLNTPVWALLNGETEHGISWHVMEAGIDKGDILVTRDFAIAEDETAHSLNSKCYAAGLDSFAELLGQIETGTLAPRPQDFATRSYFAGNKRPEAAGVLDFNQPAATLARTVRALDFSGYWNPLALPRLLTAKGTLFARSATALPAAPDAQPGQVLEATADSLTVATANGAIRLASLLDADGKPATPRALFNTGDILPALSPEAADQLTATAERLAKHQRHWRARLTDMTPVQVPLARATTGPADCAVEDVALPADLDRATALTVLAAWALQGAGQRAGDIAYAPASLKHDANTPAIATPWMPLRVETTEDTTLADLTAAVTAEIATAETRPGFPDDLALRDPSLGTLQVPAIAITDGPATIPGAVIVAALDHTGTCHLHIDRARLDEDAIRLLTARLSAMLTRAANSMPDTFTMQALCTLPKPERLLQLHTWNATDAAYDPALTIHHAFERQVEETPDATALVFEDTALTYAELNARANRAALALRDAGVRRGVNVGLCLRRSPDLLIGALAILKAGGAYVPLDPDHPADRLAHIMGDSGAPVLLAHGPTQANLPDTDAKLILLDTIPQQGDAAPANVDGGSGAEDLAYLIYTSGSTGKPKGVMVEHRNVANFFRGMDDCVDRNAGSVWLAVTSISFDISVLELFYTLARGFKVVVTGSENRAAVSNGPIAASGEPMDFSVYFWGNDDGPGPKKYQLLLDAARFADANGFAAVWTPERHFHAFGGPYPNPAVSGAAIAAVTQNISVRAGSIVAPLHHPARIAEDWAVIDNLTNGRAGLAFASGWHPDDFVLRPENTPPANKPALYDALDKARRLWRGEAVDFPTQSGEMLPVKTLPRPVSQELECWVTTAGNPQTWREAGERGAHILTHLLGQSIEEVAEKITIYHDALRGAGHDPADFKVTVMLHSFISDSREHAREIAREPMKNYLRSAAGLIKQYAWAFPAFKKPEGVNSPFEMDLGALGDDEMEAILDFAFERYFEDSGLFGTVADGVARAEQMKRIGVTEIACLIDYGIAPETVLEGLDLIKQVMDASNAPAELADDDFSLAAQIIRHDVTHLQCTPSMARILTQNDEARMSLRHVRQLLIGGEAFPADLARDLRSASKARIDNMYGPTETTVWSAHQRVDPGTHGHTVPIGTPIANTQVYILDDTGNPAPVGVAGELCIGGDGVTRGYWHRDELTAERFVPDPFAGGTARMYRTGDLARWTASGTLDFLGRDDFQVKIRGQRIELGEIEDAMKRLPGITEAVVVPLTSDTGDTRLAGYFTGTAPEDSLRTHLRAHLPEAMVPADLVQLDAMPLTPNKKIDRKSLPAPVRKARATAPRATSEATGLESRIAAVWSTVLGVQQIAPEDNFFDLGGHSLLAVQAHRDIRKALDTPTLSITDIFRFPVLRDLARHLEGGSGGDPTPPEREETSEARAATMSKRRAMRAGRERQLS
jgi:natural product biosynthesis luciferase-like monooxygenase protein